VIALFFICWKSFGKATDSSGVSAASGGSAASFHPNAWKYADLIRPDTLYPVEHVIDGDTLIANVLGHDVTVRLIGMDTPETVDPRKPVECFGPQASAEAKRILGGAGAGVATADGTSSAVEIYLEKDPLVGDYDKYGRALAYVSLPAGTMVGGSSGSDGAGFPDGLNYDLYMIQKGFAREYTYMNQHYKYQADFRAAQATAKSAGLGVWNKSVCPKPFSY